MTCPGEDKETKSNFTDFLPSLCYRNLGEAKTRNILRKEVKYIGINERT
jgi:hypothetical protein